MVRRDPLPHLIFLLFNTKIPHDKLINVLHKLIDSVFNNTNRKLIAVGNKRAYWVKKVSAKNPTFTADLLKQCVKFLINNAFFRVGDLIFRQVVGIPMGSDPAPDEEG